LGTRSRFSGAVHGLRQRNTGSAPSWPAHAGIPDDAAGFASCCGPASRPPRFQGRSSSASTPGSRPTPGVLLPGTLASPRAGLTPAGCRELGARLHPRSSFHHSAPELLDAHSPGITARPEATIEVTSSAPGWEWPPGAVFDPDAAVGRHSANARSGAWSLPTDGARVIAALRRARPDHRRHGPLRVGRVGPRPRGRAPPAPGRRSPRCSRAVRRRPDTGRRPRCCGC
jgi:hypothetical protein